MWTEHRTNILQQSLFAKSGPTMQWDDREQMTLMSQF